MAAGQPTDADPRVGGNDATAPFAGLRQPLTSFIGRARELVQIQALVATSRLLTLTGPGGIGKTRLAFEAATAVLGRFEHGVCFVALQSISDPLLVAATIAQTLGVRVAGSGPPLESLKSFLRDRQLLLVIDNFEQVIGAAFEISELLAKPNPALSEFRSLTRPSASCLGNIV